MERKRSVQELAALIGLKEPTICHHLSVLNKVDLLEMTAEGNIHWYRLRADQILALRAVGLRPGADEHRSRHG